MLYRNLFSYVMNLCVRYKQNKADAEAALNAVFVKIFENIQSLNDDRSILPWIKTVAIRLLIDEHRRSKKELEVEFNSDIQIPERYIDVNNGLNQLTANDLLMMIHDLPPITAQVFNLYCIDGYNHREIGEMLGISEGSSKWHLHQARKSLQEMLKKEEKKLNSVNLHE